MERITRIAGAAIVLVAVGLIMSLLIGGSTNLAFAKVAEALENLRTATFDETAVVTDPSEGKPKTVRMKTMFLAPSHERSERLAVPDGALVRPKDPLEYYRKLRFHQSVKSIQDYGLGA